MEEAAARNTTGPTGVVTRSRAAAREDELVAANFAQRPLFYHDKGKETESVNTDISSIFVNEI